MAALNLDPWLEGLLIIGLCVAFALIGMMAARTRVTPAMMAPHREVAGVFLGVIGTLYAVILAFAVFMVWQQYNSAQSAVDSEANSLADLARLARELPPEVGQHLQTDLEAYARSIVDREWIAMTAGTAAPETQAALAALWRTSSGRSRVRRRQRRRSCESPSHCWKTSAIAARPVWKWL